jgi:hypothetical protein
VWSDRPIVRRSYPLRLRIEERTYWIIRCWASLYPPFIPACRERVQQLGGKLRLSRRNRALLNARLGITWVKGEVPDVVGSSLLDARAGSWD